MNELICTNPSGLPDLRWVATLNNGLTVWQNDKNGNSWKNLKKYVETNDLRIVKLQLEFRSHIVNIGNGNEVGYVFSMGGRTGLGKSEIQNVYIAGILLENGLVYRNWYCVPEIEIVSKDTKYKQEVESILILK